MLASATSSSSSGALVDPLREPLGEDERVVAEHQAVGAEVDRVDAVGHGGVDARQRVVEAGTERPLPLAAMGVVECLVDGLLVHLTSSSIWRAAHMCGTFSGIS